MREKLICDIPKNAREVVRIALTEFKGFPLVDVRVFFKSATGGEPKPTRKGVCVRLGLLPDLIAALTAAEQEAAATGLLNARNDDDEA